MKLKGFLPKERRSHWDPLEYPFPYGRWTELSRDENGVHIEFDAERLDVLVDCCDAITPKNVKEIWALIRPEFVRKAGWRLYGNIPQACLNAMGQNFMTVYDFLYDQKGVGFMGGTGCGKKIHHLTYNKVTGVKTGANALITEIAEAWYNLMLGELRYQRKETKHIRDNIAEPDLVLTFGAVPGCQRTVAHHDARGFPLATQSLGKITCAKCAKVGA